jgi:hypothetical protein
MGLPKLEAYQYMLKVIIIDDVNTPNHFDCNNTLKAIPHAQLLIYTYIPSQVFDYMSHHHHMS